MHEEEQESTVAERISTKYCYQILQRNSEYVALVLKYKLGECRQSPTQKRCVGINFVSTRQGHVSQMCRDLAVGATCLQHVGNFSSQDDKEPKPQAFVAVNYSPKIGGIGTYMHYLSFQCFVNVMHQLTIVFTFIVFIFYMNSFLHQIHIIHECVSISVCQVDMWNDFVDEDGNKLNIGKLKYQTKHGKFCPLRVHYVPARNVKSALVLVVYLFLKHSKVTERSSMVQDSAMFIFKETTNADMFHFNLFGKVNANFACFVIDFLFMLLLFDAYTDHNANAAPAPWAGRDFSMSERELIQENQLILIKFCLKQNEDMA
jgi:hypothetical protein